MREVDLETWGASDLEPWSRCQLLGWPGRWGVVVVGET